MKTRRPKIRINSHHLYRNYVKYKRKANDDYILPKPRFYKYVLTITDEIENFLIEGNYFILPYNLGHMFVRKNIPNYLRRDEFGNWQAKNSLVNWKETWKLRREKEPDKPDEYWKKFENRNKYIVFFNNEHTGGYVYRFDYITSTNGKIDAEKAVASLFKFRVRKRVKKKLAQFIFKNSNKLPTYYEQSQRYINFRKIKEKIAERNKSKQRDGYRKHLERIKANRDKTE